MKVKRKMIGESEHAEWSANEWADASFEVPVDTIEGLLVIVSGEVAGVRFVHAVLFADYDPEEGWDFEHGVEGADEHDVDLDVEYWRPIPELPEDVAEALDGLAKEDAIVDPDEDRSVRPHCSDGYDYDECWAYIKRKEEYCRNCAHHTEGWPKDPREEGYVPTECDFCMVVEDDGEMIYKRDHFVPRYHSTTAAKGEGDDGGKVH